MPNPTTLTPQQAEATEIVVVEVVFPSMLNNQDTLFGGYALQWMDRAAWICATRYARLKMVTVASDRVVFKAPVVQGDMVELRARVIKVGNTSVTIEVQLHAEAPLTGEQHLATRGEFVLVALGDDGKPKAVPKP